MEKNYTFEREYNIDRNIILELTDNRIVPSDKVESLIKELMIETVLKEPEIQTPIKK